MDDDDVRAVIVEGLEEKDFTVPEADMLSSAILPPALKARRAREYLARLQRILDDPLRAKRIALAPLPDPADEQQKSPASFTWRGFSIWLRE